FLTKISELIEETDAGDRHREIAGGLQLVAGNVPQSARIDWQSFAEHELHGEIRNPSKAGTRMCPLKPSFGAQSRFSFAIELSETLLKLRLRRDRLQSLPRHCLQHNPRIVSLLPEFRVDALPELIRRVVERPSKV